METRRKRASAREADPTGVENLHGLEQPTKRTRRNPKALSNVTNDNSVAQRSAQEKENINNVASKTLRGGQRRRTSSNCGTSVPSSSSNVDKVKSTNAAGNTRRRRVVAVENGGRVEKEPVESASESEPTGNTRRRRSEDPSVVRSSRSSAGRSSTGRVSAGTGSDNSSTASVLARYQRLMDPYKHTEARIVRRLTSGRPQYCDTLQWYVSSESDPWSQPLNNVPRNDDSDSDDKSLWWGEGVRYRAAPGCPRGRNTTRVPSNLEDIDLRHPNDPLYCQAYVKDIYSHLRSAQFKYLLRNMQLTQASVPRAHRVTVGMRAILIDWLVEVAEDYMLLSDTLYLCIKYVDRFLSLRTVPKRDLQLVGCACLLLAAKYEEQFAPGVDEFVIISDNSYDRREILRMEITVLKALDYKLTVSTAKTFLRRFQRAACTTGREKHLSNYLAELTLTSYALAACPSDVIAAAACYLARLTLYASDSEHSKQHVGTSMSFFNDSDVWTGELVWYSGFSPVYLAKVIEKLHELHLVAWRERSRAIFEKYSLAVFDKVAKVIRPYTGSAFPKSGDMSLKYWDLFINVSGNEGRIKN